MHVHRKLHDPCLEPAYEGANKAMEANDMNGILHREMLGPNGRIAYVHEGHDKNLLPTTACELNTLLARGPVSASVFRPGSRPAPTVNRQPSQTGGACARAAFHHYQRT
jgi:hypothetical protein